MGTNRYWKRWGNLRWCAIISFSHAPDTERESSRSNAAEVAPDGFFAIQLLPLGY